MEMNRSKSLRWKLALFVGLVGTIALAAGYLVRDRFISNEMAQPRDGSSIARTRAEENGQGKQTSEKGKSPPSNFIVRPAAMVSPAVVSITVTEAREVRTQASKDPLLRYFAGDKIVQERAVSVGSGFIISPDGYILTNDHVIENARKITITLTNGKHYRAHIVGANPISDVGILKIDTVGLPFVKLGNSNELVVGEWVIALGNPFGLFEINNQPTVTVGVVSATHMNFETPSDHRVYREMIQTDAAINSGNSGGPLVNGYGEVVGINSIIFTPSEGSVGIGFAIPINRVKAFLAELRDRGKSMTDIWLGFQCEAVTENLARIFSLPTAQGVIVSLIERGSPAEKSGLRVNDIILEVNHITIEHDKSLVEVLFNAKIGDELKLKVLRRGKIVQLSLKLVRRP